VATSAVARDTLASLRREIARIEGVLPEVLEAPASVPAARDLPRHAARLCGNAARLALGAPALDAALAGGVPPDGLVEIHGGQMRDAGAVCGFALGLAALFRKRRSQDMPVLWISTSQTLAEAGRPYIPGILHRFGISPATLLFAQARKVEDALWVAEEAAGLAGFAAVLLETCGVSARLDLTATRRLHRRAHAAARPFYLLRHAGVPEPTAAPVRLLVSAAPAAERRTLAGSLAGSIGPPAFEVEIGRSLTAIPAAAVLEWNRDECTFNERPERTRRAQDAGAMVPVAAERAHPAGPDGPRLALRGAA
jgi:protein ImuA